MRTLRVLLFVVAAASVLLAQGRPGKPARMQPTVAEQTGKVEFHNSEVTVRELDIPAGGSEAVSADTHDYLLVSLGNNSLRVTGYQTDFELKFGDGDIQVVQGGWPHKLENESSHAAQLVMVEVARSLFPRSARCGLGSKDCAETRYGQSGAGEYRQRTLFETDTANLYRVSMGAGVNMHQHDDVRPHLLIALTSFQGHADNKTFSLQPRQAFWHDGSIHEVGNDGSAEARFLILELKKKY
ncbi:MAG: hypothetical protein ROO76_04580 [Terriglobia bacterium]|nr:hypothetical protein [Terriglobia bacterium]